MKRSAAALAVAAAFAAPVAYAGTFPGVVSTPNRISGAPAVRPCGGGGTNYAPCIVFFDYTGITDTQSGFDLLPYNTLEFSTDFGEPTLGNWTNGIGTSKNTAIGGTVAHVFETPGTYYVTTDVTDGTNSARWSTKVTVADPSVGEGFTIWCVSGGTPDYTGCPSGGTGYNVGDFGTAINNKATGDKVRILFHAGETFTQTVTAAIAHNNVIVGKYGNSASRPVIQTSGASGGGHAMAIGDTSTTVYSGIVVSDIVIQPTSLNTNFDGITGVGSFKNSLFLRVDLKDMARGYGLAATTLDSLNSSGCSGTPGAANYVCDHPMWDNIAIVGGTISGMQTSTGYGLFVSATRYAQIDTSVVADASGQHGQRIPFTYLADINNNTWSGNAANNLTLFTLRGPCWLPSIGSCTATANKTIPANNQTQYVNFNRNKIDGSTYTEAQPLAITPSSTGFNERHAQVVVDSNWIIAGASTTTGISDVCPSNDVLRNNLIDKSAAANGTGINLSLSAGANSTCDPAQASPNNNPATAVVVNNTIYSSASGSLEGIKFGSSFSTASAHNNLVYQPNNSASPRNAVGGCTGSVTCSNNTANSASGGGANDLKTDPLFTSVSPFNPAGAVPSGSSYAKGLGTNPRKWFIDWNGRAQPASSAGTAGAFCPASGC